MNAGISAGRLRDSLAITNATNTGNANAERIRAGLPPVKTK